jgi:ABC-type transporter Mla subunit MlaD
MALNGNGDGPSPETDLGLQRLPQNWGIEDDDPLLPLLQANAQLEGKVEQWSTAILELAALARNQNQAMQETSQNSLRLTNALSSFEQESVQLRALIKLLGSSLTELKSGAGKSQEGLNQNALQTLIPVLKAIKTDIEDIERTIDLTQDIVQDGSASRKRLEGLMALQVGGFIGLLVCGYVFYTRVTGQQAFLWQQSSWMLTKLERIEKALGVESRK